VVRAGTRRGGHALIDASGHIGNVGRVVRRRLIPLAAIGAAIVAVGLPAGASAQGGGPFPGDQQPISDEYGLPPLDHPSHSGGAGATATGGGSSNGVFGTTGGSADSSLRVGDVQRGEARRGSAGAGRQGGDQASAGRVGIGRPIPPPTSQASDPRGGFDVLLLVLAGLAAAGLVVAGLAQLRRPGRPI
jgi:hypothetical protein